MKNGYCTNTNEVQAHIDELVGALELALPELLGVDFEDVNFLDELMETEGSLCPEIESLIAHLNFRAEVQQNNTEWSNGIQLMYQGDLHEFVKEELVDIGVIDRRLPDYVVVDWEQTAQNLYYTIDYVQIELNGTSYFVRKN